MTSRETTITRSTSKSVYPEWLFDNSPIDDPAIFKTKNGEMIGGGERAVRFLRALKHSKSSAKGRAFTLDYWQERLIRAVYGPRHLVDIPELGIRRGDRIIKTVFLLLPRGGRKTTLAAAMALLHTIGPEKVEGGEVITAASDRKQARLAYTEALGMIRSDARIEKAVSAQDYRNRILYPKHGSFFESISADAGTQHGRTPAFVLADELHAWPKRDLWDVLRSGLIKTPNTLMVIATTAGRGQDNLAYEHYAKARKVALGEIDDPAFLPVLFETAADADWRDPEVWRRANPGMSCPSPYPDLAGFRQYVKDAEGSPGDRDAFRQLSLNVWLDHSTSPFVDMAVYDAGNVPVDLEALRGRQCWLGVDLSSTGDLTAIVAAFPDEDGGYGVVPWFFCPADNLRAKADKDGVPYPTWAEAGHIIPTPGNVVDLRIVEQKVRDLCADLDVAEIAFDPHMGRVTMANLAEDGFPVVEFRQGWISMAPAVKELERAILGGKFRHGGHPVLRWNFSNIAVEIDKAENKSFHKGKSKDRIDGAVAAAMAVSRASQGHTQRSIYADASARPDGLLIF